MISGYKFRIAIVVMAFITMGYSSAAFVSEILSSNRPAFPSDPARIAAPSVSVFEDLAVDISPLGGSVEASHAMILGLQALRSNNDRALEERKALNERAQIAVRAALSLTPYDSQIWLILALLQSQIDPRNARIIESLKMSYFTAPNDIDLMPVRLDAATLFGAITDADLMELVRGDIRLILTRRPDLRVAISNAYRRASAEGKAFLESAVNSIDPKFAATLRGASPN
jgi:hypothetical protein